MRRSEFPVISLFSGAGGMDLGFKGSGFYPAIALDHNEAAVQTYNRNRRGKCGRQFDLSTAISEDVINIVRALHVRPCGVIGGPPCQSFSRGNIWKKRKDPRARLGLTYAKLIGALHKEFELDFVVFENVVGLQDKRHKRVTTEETDSLHSIESFRLRHVIR
jgi:DNA (cytosine-5)-methyltransferase 1